MDCIFCKIVDGKIPSTKLFENENVLGFADLTPKAKVHLLFIHKTHSTDVSEMASQNPNDIGEVFAAMGEYALKNGLATSGYRILVNTGKNAGQTVFHTHFHFLAGEKLSGL